LIVYVVTEELLVNAANGSGIVSILRELVLGKIRFESVDRLLHLCSFNIELVYG